MDITVQAALISSTVTMTVLYFKDYLPINIKKGKEKNDEKKNREVYLTYSEPLAISAEGLFWRLNEILHHNSRARFLEKNTVQTDLSEYKYISTLYRLANLLGWIRIIRKDLSFIACRGDRCSQKLSAAIDNLERALSDGPHIDETRAVCLANIWNLNTQDHDLRSIGVEISRIIERDLSLYNAEFISDLSAKKSLKSIRACADFLCDTLNCPPITDKALIESQYQAAQKLSIKEAWLYRDWQAGIGDFMMRSNTMSGHPNIIGYKEFESMYHCKDQEISKWIRRIDTVFNDVRVNDKDRNDMRINQIRSTFYALSNLILTIEASGFDNLRFNKNTVPEANKYILNHPRIDQMNTSQRLVDH